MVLASSSTHSQQPATCPYPEPSQFTVNPHPISLLPILILSFHLRLGLSNGLFSHIPSKTQQASVLFSIRATYPVHGILIYLIARMIFHEEYLRNKKNVRKQQKMYEMCFKNTVLSHVTSSILVNK